MQRLIRRMSGERWQIERAYFKLDDEGHGDVPVDVEKLR